MGAGGGAAPKACSRDPRKVTRNRLTKPPPDALGFGTIRNALPPKTAKTAHEFAFHGIHKEKPVQTAPYRFKIYQKLIRANVPAPSKMPRIHRKWGLSALER